MQALPVSIPPSRPAAQPRRQHVKEERETARSMEEDESLSLSNFVEQFSTLLPLQITVKKGYHGSDERHSVAADDVYNVHFVKRTKVVVLQEGRDVTFTVPLNSVVKFAPVFNPNDDPEEAMRGFTFERVSDIMAQKTLPKIVRALKPHVKVDPVSTIEQNEMFVVQKVVLVGMRKKALQVFSVMRGEEKLLPSDSVGGFTTEPQLTCIYLPEIINRFLSDFPLDVLVVMNDGGLNQDIPYYLTTEISRLTGVDSETSLIVSTSWGQNEKVSDEDQMPIDIPVDLPIEVAVCQPDDGKESDLSRSTKKLFERFDPCNIRSLRGRSVRRGFEKEGTELQRPDRIYDIPAVRQTRRNVNQPLPIPTNKASSSKHSREENGSTHPVPKPRSHSTKQGQCHMYEPLVIQTQLHPNPKLQYAVPEQHSLVKTNTVHSSADSNDPLGAGGGAGVTPASAAGRRRSKLSPLSSAELAGLASERGPDMKLMAARVEALEREVYALRSEMAKLRAQIPSVSNGTRAGGVTSSVTEITASDATQMQNVEHLRSLSLENVIVLLQAMGLSQYQNTFLTEKINGNILSKCNGKILQEELGVSSRLHCMRLQLVISGKTSAAALMAGKTSNS